MIRCIWLPLTRQIARLYGFVRIPKRRNEKQEDGEQFQSSDEHNKAHENFEERVGKHVKIAVYQLAKPKAGVGKQSRCRAEGGFKVQVLKRQDQCGNQVGDPVQTNKRNDRRYHWGWYIFFAHFDRADCMGVETLDEAPGNQFEHDHNPDNLYGSARGRRATPDEKQ